MDTESRILRLIVLMGFMLILVGPRIFKFLKNLLVSKNKISIYLTEEERQKIIKLWNKLLTKDWGFKFIEGNLDDFPDSNVLMEFNKPLSESEQEELKKIFTNWYEIGVNEGSEEDSKFGGVMHYMHDPQFKDKYADFSFDFGTVEIVNALDYLLTKLSDWNKGKIAKVVIGQDKDIFNKFLE